MRGLRCCFRHRALVCRAIFTEQMAEASVGDGRSLACSWSRWTSVGNETPILATRNWAEPDPTPRHANGYGARRIDCLGSADDIDGCRRNDWRRGTADERLRISFAGKDRRPRRRPPVREKIIAH